MVLQLHCLPCCILFIAGALISTADLATVTRQFHAESQSLAIQFASVSRQPARSRIHCAALCGRRSGCLTFAFSSVASECQMSNEESGGFATAGLTVYNSGLRWQADPGLAACRRVYRDTRLFCIAQQRLTDTVNFSRPWQDYELGFGDDNNFWIGLQLLNLITSKSNSLTFRAEIYDWFDALYIAEYSGFVVQNASANYTVNYTGFLAAQSNVSGDSLTMSKGKMFSTTDRDNDNLGGGSCSNIYHGGAGWWFGGCSNVNPNGWMTSAEVNTPKSIHWYNVHGNKHSLKAIRLLAQLP